MSAETFDITSPEFWMPVDNPYHWRYTGKWSGDLWSSGALQPDRGDAEYGRSGHSFWSVYADCLVLHLDVYGDSLETIWQDGIPHISYDNVSASNYMLNNTVSHSRSHVELRNDTATVPVSSVGLLTLRCLGEFYHYANGIKRITITIDPDLALVWLSPRFALEGV